MENHKTAIDEVSALRDTVESWRNELARANEIRGIVKEIKQGHDQVLAYIRQQNLPELVEEIKWQSAKLDVLIRFMALLVREDKDTLTKFQEMAKESLGTGDILAHRDVHITQKGGK